MPQNGTVDGKRKRTNDLNAFCVEVLRNDLILSREDALDLGGNDIKYSTFLHQ